MSDILMLIAISLISWITILYLVLVETFRFDSSHNASKIMGEKDGPITSLIIRHKMIGPASLELWGSGRSTERWTDVSIEGDHVTVSRSGTTKTFLIKNKNT
jgi:hypothetical protein